MANNPGITHIGKPHSSKMWCGAENPSLLVNPWRESNCFRCLDNYGLYNIAEAKKLFELGEKKRDAAQSRGIVNNDAERANALR